MPGTEPGQRPLAERDRTSAGKRPVRRAARRSRRVGAVVRRHLLSHGLLGHHHRSAPQDTAMRAEIANLASSIKEGLELQRRHL